MAIKHHRASLVALLQFLLLVAFIPVGHALESQQKYGALNEATAVQGPEVAYATEVIPLKRNGIPLHLQRLGIAGERADRQILLVHGLTYSSHEFDTNHEDYSLARFLARHGYGVWTLDIAGYGQSGSVTDGFVSDSSYAAQDIAAAVKKILAITGEKKIDILGWSWGTVTSSIFVAQHPDLVNRLVLYAPILVGLGKADVKDAYNHNTWIHAAGDFQTTSSGEIDYAIVDPAVVATFQSNCWRYDKDSSPNGGRRDLLVSAESRLIPIDKIKVPTLVLCGDRDPYLHMDRIRDAISELPDGSRLDIIQGAAHAMMLEKPYYHKFQQAVLAFLASGTPNEKK